MSESKSAVICRVGELAMLPASTRGKTYACYPIDGLAEFRLWVDVCRGMHSSIGWSSLKMEPGDDCWETWTAASSCPVEVCILLLVTMQLLAVCSHDIDRDDALASPTPILDVRFVRSHSFFSTRARSHDNEPCNSSPCLPATRNRQCLHQGNVRQRTFCPVSRGSH